MTFNRINPERTPSQSAEAHEREEWISLGMMVIDPEDRQVIMWKTHDKLTFAAIGDKLGINLDAARMRYNRAVTRLSEKVGELRHGKPGEGEIEADP